MLDRFLAAYIAVGGVVDRVFRGVGLLGIKLTERSLRELIVRGGGDTPPTVVLPRKRSAKGGRLVYGARGLADRVDEGCPS